MRRESGCDDLCDKRDVRFACFQIDCISFSYIKYNCILLFHELFFLLNWLIEQIRQIQDRGEDRT